MFQTSVFLRENINVLKANIWKFNVFEYANFFNTT